MDKSAETQGYKNLTYMTRTFLKPLLARDKLIYTIPEKPQSPLQKYIVPIPGQKTDNHDL